MLAANNSIGIAVNAANYTFIDRLACGAYAYAMYVIKFIFPYQLSGFYQYPIHLPVIAYVCLAVVPVLLLLALWKARKNPVVVFGLLFFAINIMFVLQILSAGSQMMADRFTYIAYTGFFFMTAKGYEWITQRYVKHTKAINYLLAGYLMIFAFMTYNYIKVWKNTISFWEHFIDHNKDVVFGYSNLGGYYIDLANKLPDPYVDANDPELRKMPLHYFLLAAHEDSLIGFPSEYAILNNLGLGYGIAGEYQAGINTFAKAIALQPNTKGAYDSRAQLYSNLNENDSALMDYKRYERLDPNNAQNHFNAAVCEAKLEQFRPALEDINKSIAILSTNPNSYLLRANIYQALNMQDSMQLDQQKAKQLQAAMQQ